MIRHPPSPLGLGPALRLQLIGAGAAFLRGYADRAPHRYRLAVDKTATRSRALEREYDVMRTTPERLFGAPDFDGIPVSDATRLLVDAAPRPGDRAAHR